MPQRSAHQALYFLAAMYPAPDTLPRTDPESPLHSSLQVRQTVKPQLTERLMYPVVADTTYIR